MTQVCYRHPNRETRVSCSACGRPICPECMTPTPVGMRCPECARQRTRVTRGAVGPGGGDLPATFALIAINVVVYLAEIASGSGGFEAGGKMVLDYGLYGPFVAEGDWYRLLTSGFLHASLFHIGFNMLLLYLLGRILEPAIGTVRFVALYFASLFAGSLGALLLSPNSLTIGASGAIFGVAGATFVLARARGAEALASSMAILLLINLAFSFSSARISLGAHLGGLVGGVLCALIVVAGERGMLGRNRMPIELVGMIAVAAIAIVAGIGVA